ncbi:MAG: Lsr2 family protein [Actinobacteria bacterium]|nr:Lsr2 family protein [Actinomycetota bacterium]MBW3648663.1 Lsr2 family protein [Actinomycetota bacterium]
MAQKVNVVLVDDLDGSEAVETVSFTLDGSSYEIDLNRANAAALRDALAPWVGAARRAGRTTSAPASRRSSRGGSRPAAAGSDRGRVQAIREWARTNGHNVSERGRLSADVLAAYEAAH